MTFKDWTLTGIRFSFKNSDLPEFIISPLSQNYIGISWKTQALLNPTFEIDSLKIYR